jgi:hypothetical protein
MRPNATHRVCSHRTLAIVSATSEGGDQNPPRARANKFSLRGLTREEKHFLQATLSTVRGIFRTETHHAAAAD